MRRRIPAARTSSGVASTCSAVLVANETATAVSRIEVELVDVHLSAACAGSSIRVALSYERGAGTPHWTSDVAGPLPAGTSRPPSAQARQPGDYTLRHCVDGGLAAVLAGPHLDRQRPREQQLPGSADGHEGHRHRLRRRPGPGRPDPRQGNVSVRHVAPARHHHHDLGPRAARSSRGRARPAPASRTASGRTGHPWRPTASGER